MTLTYGVAIDPVANNDVVLNLCKALAEHLMVPYNRVQDAWGGSFGNKSPMLPAARRMLQDGSTSEASTSVTDASTSASEASTSASAPAAQTEWPIEVFVQPDPRAETVDSSVTATAL